jgi:exonuclease SbcD
MRILHFADLHLGVENYSGGIDPDTGLSLRLLDFLNAFDEVVEHALHNNVDLVLFCGDAYKSREPSQTHQREFARRIWEMASAGIHVLLLTGNHDVPSAIGRATTMEIFGTLEIDNVTVANRAGTYRLETKAGPIQVVALPWARRNALISREETKNLTLDQINERIEGILTEQLDREIAALDRELPAVLAAHIYVSSATFGSERSMIMGNDYMLLQSNVARPEFDYVALGHIHKKQVLSENPPMVYPGSLQRIDFSEEQDEKGFFVVDIGRNRQVDFRFQPVRSRPFLTIDVNIDPQESDPTKKVLQAISSHDITDSVVRVKVSIPENLDRLLNESEIRKALSSAHYVAAIARDIEREHRPRMPVASVESLEPMEALKAYLSTKKPRLPIDSLLEYGERLIHGGDIEN